MSPKDVYSSVAPRLLASRELSEAAVANVNAFFGGYMAVKPNFAVLRKLPNINLLIPAATDKITPPDFYRLVAAVEENNAEFEGFYLNDLPGRPDRMLGYPIWYSDDIGEGEVFGGMWSDLKEDGTPNHEGAFALLSTRPCTARRWEDKGMRRDRTTGLECVCTHCDKHFVLAGGCDDATAFGLKVSEVTISSCESGGVYDAYVKCPHCDHRHGVMT